MNSPPLHDEPRQPQTRGIKLSWCLSNTSASNPHTDREKQASRSRRGDGALSQHPLPPHRLHEALLRQAPTSRPGKHLLELVDWFMGRGNPRG